MFTTSQVTHCESEHVQDTKGMSLDEFGRQGVKHELDLARHIQNTTGNLLQFYIFVLPCNCKEESFSNIVRHIMQV